MLRSVYLYCAAVALVVGVYLFVVTPDIAPRVHIVIAESAITATVYRAWRNKKYAAGNDDGK